MANNGPSMLSAAPLLNPSSTPLLEILPELPQLVVSGINYGENLGEGVTISGTVGAALEAASFGIPGIAVSLETETRHHYTHSAEVDFTTAAYFTALFGEMLLEKKLPPDVNVLKLEIPCDATPDTPWSVARLSHMRYFKPVAPQRASWDVPARVGYSVAKDLKHDDPSSDVYTVHILRRVAVTPLSLDMTSRIDLMEFEHLLRENR